MTLSDTIVLTVEDEPAIAELVKYSLGEESARCYAVSTIAEAWDFL
jgi:two-component system phosphate regulon response regulator PhoB